MRRNILSVLILSLFLAGTSMAWQSNQYNFEVGDTYVANSTIEQETSQMVMGTEQSQSSQTTSTETYEIIEATDDTYTIRNTINKMRTETQSQMGNQVLDSEGDSPSDLGLKAMSGKSFTFTIDRHGNILGFGGLEEVRAAVEKELEGTSVAVQASQFAQTYTEESLRNSIAGVFSIYPDEPADEWTKNRNMVRAGAPTDIAVTYSWKDDETIDVSAEVTVDGEMNQGGMQMNINLSGNQTGTLTIDPETGMVKEAINNGDMTGIVSTQGMEIPMTITTTVTNTITKQ